MKNILRTGERRKFTYLVRNVRVRNFKSSHVTLLPQPIDYLEGPGIYFFPTREIKKCNRNKLQSLETSFKSVVF